MGMESGPEIVTEAMKVLDKTAEKYGHACKYTQLLLGGDLHRRTWDSAD